MRDTLTNVANVHEAAVDMDAGLAYVVPEDGFEVEKAIAALGETGKYTASLN